MSASDPTPSGSADLTPQYRPSPSRNQKQRSKLKQPAEELPVPLPVAPAPPPPAAGGPAPLIRRMRLKRSGQMQELTAPAEEAPPREEDY